MEHLELIWQLCEYLMFGFHMFVWARWAIKRLPKRKLRPKISTGPLNMQAINAIFKEVYADKMEDLIYKENSMLMIAKMKDGSEKTISHEDILKECIKYEG